MDDIHRFYILINILAEENKKYTNFVDISYLENHADNLHVCVATKGIRPNE